MKILTLLLPAIVITSMAVAQKTPVKETPQPEPTSMREGIMQKDGKTWYIKSLVNTMTLSGGVQVMTDGTVKTQDGKIYNMSDNDCINFQGQLVGLNQRKNIVDGMIIKRHTMWVWSILNKPFLLKNGTYAMPDGTLKDKDGKYIKLKDNEFVDFDGNISMQTKN